MAISKDLLLAILSMDSYNRGYGAGLRDGGEEDEDGLGEAGALIAGGVVKNIQLPANAETYGFYAIAYEFGSNAPDGLTNTTVISYRGTDNRDLEDIANDVINGWPLALGQETLQLDLALEFYEDVAGVTLGDPSPDNVIVTGHSLGGALAGIVSTLGGVTGLGFNHMPFGNVIGAAADYHGPLRGTVLLPDYSHFTASHVAGEVVAPIRGLFSTTEEAGQPNNAIDPFYSGTLFGIDWSEYLHRSDVMVIMTYASELGSAHWGALGAEFHRAFSDDAIALAAAAGAVGGTLPDVRKMGQAIAYSALDTGALVFGNTGIRAIFDDLQALGEGVEATDLLN